MRVQPWNLALATVLTMTAANAALEVEVDQPAATPAISVPAPVNGATADTPAAGTGAAAASMSSTLAFLTGDSIRGELVLIDAKQGLTWKHPDAGAPIIFGLANLREVRLAEPPADSQAASLAMVTLTNDDQLPGKLLEITEQAVTLETSYAGRLSLVRSLVRSIAPGAAVAASVYEGPTGMDGWVSQRGSQGTWSYKNGSFISTGRNGSIGREIAMPEVARIDFDLAWRGTPGFTLSFCGERVDNPNQGAYMLNVQNDYFSLYRFSPPQGSNELGSFNQQGFTIKGKARFSIRVDRPKKSVALLINGALVRQFTDTAAKPPAGKCLYLGCSQGLLKVSNISVTKWDGKMENAAGTADGEEASADDTLFFGNGDKVRGKLKTAKDGKINFATAYATMDVPVDRVAVIEFGKGGQERARRNAGDVQLVFPAGQRVTMNLEKLAAGTAAGKSENFGAATFKLAAFGKINFNLYDDRREADGAAGAEW